MRDVFYNREWDYLFVKCGEGKPDRSLDENGATLLYRGDEFLGANIAHPKGIKLQDGLNVRLSSKDEEALKGYLGAHYQSPEPSNFVYAKVVFKEEHPLYERKSILTLDAGKRLSTVTGYQNVEVGDSIAILLPGPRMDGTYFAPRVEKNIAIDCEVCSPKDLRRGDDGTKAYIGNDEEAGKPVF